MLFVGLMLTAPVALGGFVGSTGEEVFARFGSDNPGPADDVSFFKEIFSVLAAVFDLVEIGLVDGEWAVRGILHRWRRGWKNWFRGFL